MRPFRPIPALLAVLLLTAFGLPAAAQTDEPEAMSIPDRNALEREIKVKERRLKRFTAAIRELRSAGRQTNQTPAREAVAAAEAIMHDVLSYEQDKLGEDYVIKRPGELAETVHTNDLTDERSVRTRSRRRHSLPPDTPLEYLRLVRLQDIVAALQTLREHAITGTGEAPARYANLTMEFAGIMRDDLDELRERLPEVEDPGLYYPLRTDSTETEPAPARPDGG